MPQDRAFRKLRISTWLGNGESDSDEEIEIPEELMREEDDSDWDSGGSCHRLV